MNNSTFASWDQFFPAVAYNVPVALAIDRYVTLVWCVIGTIGNALSAKVWLSRRMRKCNTAATYLVSLAVSDLLFLGLHTAYELQYPWHQGVLDVQGWCQAWNMLHMTTQYLCMLLVLAFTFERFFSVCHPFKCERFARSSRGCKVVVILACLSLGLSAPQAFFWGVHPVSGECALRDAASHGDLFFFYNLWTWCSELALFALVPLTVLVLNVLVLRQIKSVGRFQVSSNVTSRGHPPSRYKSTTIPLLCISFYIICAKLPVTLVYSLQMTVEMGSYMAPEEMQHDPVWCKYFLFYNVRRVIEEVGMSHHACNVLVYCVSSRQFRLYLRGMLAEVLACLQGRTADKVQKTIPRVRLLKRRKHLPRCV